MAAPVIGANANKLNGFTPVGYLNAADWDGRGRVYTIPATNTNAIAVGDPVRQLAGLDASYQYACIDIGAPGVPLVGVVLALSTNKRGMGPWVDPTQLNTILHRPATATPTDWYALVGDDPNIVYEGQEQTTGNVAGTNFTAAAAGKNANFGLSPLTGPGWLSQAYVDNGTAAATTATYSLRLLSLKQSIDNYPGPWQRWWFIIQNHAYCSRPAGV
jgi:hypothetical protein